MNTTKPIAAITCTVQMTNQLETKQTWQTDGLNSW